MKSDHQLVRDYVTAIDHLQYTQLPDGVVAVLVTHSNLQANHLDIRLDLHNTIEAVKEKFRKHFGTPVDHQTLQLKDKGMLVCEMRDNGKMLGFYSVRSGMEIHVIDTDPFSLSRGGGLTDVSLIQKYRMADDAYDARENSVRAYFKQQRLKDPGFSAQPAAGAHLKPAAAGPEVNAAPGPESVAAVAVGMRGQVLPGKRRGVVKFVGEVEGLSPGFWVGICFDEPVGRSDGYVKGIKIFDCFPKYGAFVRGNNIEVGDFPERGLDDDDDEEDDGEKEECGGDENRDCNCHQEKKNDEKAEGDEDEL